LYLQYEGKKALSEIKNYRTPYTVLNFNTENNLLIKGNNFDVMKIMLDQKNMAGKIDLVYIDPPFSTNAIFNTSKERANTISKCANDTVAYKDTICGDAFLEFIRERLVLIKELLSENGSIYLHIDYKIGHYIKILMDEIFGSANFRNDIARIKCNPKNFSRKAYGNIKDMILFYAKTKKPIWNDLREKMNTEEIAKLFNKIDPDGRRYTTIPLHAPGETKEGPTGKPWRGIQPPKGRHWRSDPQTFEELDKNNLIEWSTNGVPRKKIYADESLGKKIQDIWEFKDPQKPLYPTEKNHEMLKRIIAASSNPNSIIMDCFCGSGTTLLAAQQLNRKWIGIDNSEEAILASKTKLQAYPFKYLELIPQAATIKTPSLKIFEDDSFQAAIDIF
jgi:adenine-specific DNA-methyltransferase